MPASGAASRQSICDFTLVIRAQDLSGRCRVPPDRIAPIHDHSFSNTVVAALHGDTHYQLDAAAPRQRFLDIRAAVCFVHRRHTGNPVLAVRSPRRSRFIAPIAI